MSTSGTSPDFQVKRFAYVSAAFLSATVLLFLTWPKLMQGVFSSAYMPHLYCYLGNIPLAWTHAISDSLIGLAYLSISGTLAYLVYRGRGDLPFHGLFVAFVLFIIACGGTHFFEAITVWTPVYVLSATIKVVTALASIATAAMLPFVVPDILSLVQNARVSEARRLRLEATLMERDAAQEALQHSNAILEQKVLERTAQITRINEVLAAEVTERRKNEERLRRSEERFSKAFHNSPLAMTISTEAEGRYLDVNDAFLSLLGRERHSVVGRTTFEVGFWVDPQDRIAMVKRLSEQGRVIGLATKLRVGAGEVREATVSAEQIELGGQSCVLAITQDMTETKRLQAQLQQAQKMEAIGRLAGGVAHDFNNILGVIMGFSELSLGMLDPKLPVANNLVQIKLATDHGANLTRQLLAFSRQQVISPRILDLDAVVNNVSKMLTRLVRENITLSFQPSVSLGSVKADAGQIEQVLMNLVVNARDAMPDGGEIAIETASVALDENYCREHQPVTPGEYVMLSVRDTGCGMDEATKARIFEPFFTTKEPGKGTGLGLASVYGIVKQSGGYIWAYSELGKGTTFKMYFPRVGDAAEPISVSGEVVEPVGGSETILLVEDDAAVRSVIASFLQGAGYKVLQAEDADTAIRLSTETTEPIQLLVTDAIMPKVTGIQLSKSLKAMRPSLKILLMSGYAGNLLARQEALAPEMALLEKPFSKSSLLSKVRATLQE
jgi:PAS domain S-box-containing protein